MRRRVENGAVGLEYAGAIMIAAIVVGAIMLAVTTDNRVSRAVSAAVCEIMTLGQGNCSSGSSSDAADREPKEPCVLSANGHDADLTVSAGVTVGNGANWLVEELSDGTFRVTRGQDASVAAGVGVGFNITATVDGTDYGGAANAGASVSADFSGGDVFRVADQASVDRLLAAHWTDVGMDHALGNETSTLPFTDIEIPNPGRWVVDQVSGLVGVPDLPTPDETFLSSGISSDAQAQLTLITGNLEAGAGAAVEIGRRDGRDGSSTTYYAVSVSGNAGAATWASDDSRTRAVLHEAIAEGRLDGAIEVERDVEGNVTSVSLVSTQSGTAFAGAEQAGEGVMNRTHITLPITSDDDARIAANMLGTLGLWTQPGLRSPDAVGNPVESITEFAGAVADHGTATKQSFTTDDTRHGGNFDAKWILEVGFSGGVDMIERSSDEATYFNGDEWVPWEACGA